MPIFHFMEWYKIFSKEKLKCVFEDEPYTERWVYVDLFPDYMISDFGRVKSIRRNIILRQRKFKKGYMAIDLRLNEVRHTKYVHILGASAFVENQFNKPQVNHNDRIRGNNFFKNLTWVTNQENVQHGWDNGRIGWKKQRQLNAGAIAIQK